MDAHRPALSGAWRALAYAIPLGFLAVFFVVPLVAIVERGLSGPGDSALDVLGDPLTREVLWFTAWQAVVSTALTVVVALPGVTPLVTPTPMEPTSTPALTGTATLTGTTTLTSTTTLTNTAAPAETAGTTSSTATSASETTTSAASPTSEETNTPTPAADTPTTAAGAPSTPRSNLPPLPIRLGWRRPWRWCGSSPGATAARS